VDGSVTDVISGQKYYDCHVGKSYFKNWPSPSPKKIVVCVTGVSLKRLGAVAH
jgi:hypothetical protein